MISIVTVVYSAEISLLALQARSIAKMFKDEDLSEIVVIVNDRNEQSCLTAAKAQKNHYGKFSERVRFVAASEVFANPVKHRGVLQRLSNLYASAPKPFKGKYFGGWNGNPGWRVQQALKLLSSRIVNSDYTLILDAKNVFISPVSRTDFIAQDGRPKWRSITVPTTQRKWVVDSFKRFNVTPPTTVDLLPPSVTPFVCRTNTLRSVCDQLEERVGFLGSFFTTNLRKDTEFMLIAACVTAKKGSLWLEFAEGLQRPLTIFHSATKDHIDSLLQMAATGEYKIFSVHRLRAESMTTEQKSKLSALWLSGGLISDPRESAQWIGS